MHYLSQCISINFLKKDAPKTFWVYDIPSRRLVSRNIDKLFSNLKTWGQAFENILRGNDYENKLAPLLKDLCSRKIDKFHVIGPNCIYEAMYNGLYIENEEEKRVLWKLFLQMVLLQRSFEMPDSNTEEILAKIYQLNDGNYPQMAVSLFEINSTSGDAPLILIDGMMFSFIVPDAEPETAGHICFMFPINETRLLLWTSKENDYKYFAQKYNNIHYLNLCRINQHEKKCRIASANKEYLDYLIPKIDSFVETGNIITVAKRTWN